MRELDHRVKNNLAAVLAIVDQTAARSETLDEFMTNFRGRVVAMARLHSSLAACRWRGGELQALVRQTLEPYTHDTEGRVVLKGSVVTLPPAAVFFRLHGPPRARHECIAVWRPLRPRGTRPGSNGKSCPRRTAPNASASSGARKAGPALTPPAATASDGS